MTQSKWLRVLMLGVFIFSLPLIACSNDADDAEGADIDDTTDVSNGSATAADFDAEEIRESMLKMNQEMFDIISGIESVEDVQEADEEIGEIFEDLAANMRSGMQNPTEMQKMEMEMQQDPKMQEWDQKINAAMETLRTEHPEAAAELDKVMQKHGQKMQQVMMEAAEQMQELMEPQEGGVPGAPPEENPDSVNPGE
jgi:hypothetical protein